MSMQKIKCMQDSNSMGQAGEYDHNVEPLMARTKNIESLFEPPFGKLETELAANRITTRLRLKLKVCYLDSICGGPQSFRPKVTKTHSRPIRWFCSAQPYFMIP
jgi:hypothetical protein